MYEDCITFSDTCPDDKFQCKGGWCVDIDNLCNGWNDCGDKSDEENCTELCPAQYQCASGVFSGGNTPAKCIPLYEKCDKFVDCSGGDDEENCDYDTCPDDKFQCKGGWCVDIDNLCNGWNDCGDKSDEENCTELCPAQYQCASGVFLDGNTPAKCIPLYEKCDKFVDCSGGDDEQNCDY
uniref:Prolow-density lipoprotein receptor-related protein 1-like n=1 Tax=Saccoglossus kowalevskii TaxID=10224 RepID=A0ABM0N0A7_SACKO